MFHGMTSADQKKDFDGIAKYFNVCYWISDLMVLVKVQRKGQSWWSLDCLCFAKNNAVVEE